MSRIACRAVLLSSLLFPAVAIGQPIYVGQQLLYGGNVSPTGVETNVNLYYPANLIGQVTRATFGWSNSPCPAAVKIKFFRPITPGNPISAFSFLTERGPFDVTQPLQTPSATTPPVTQTVPLDPPVDLQPGDIIAITNLTQCGGPTFNAQLPGPAPSVLPPTVSASFPVPGDVAATVQVPATVRPGVFVYALGNVPGLFMLGRFQVTLEAQDPRTGRTTTGVPNSISATAGYFSLPDFTGDATFPEVTVKMVDASSNPALGGTFWFFHAPLTDVLYTLMVKDLTTGTLRSYPSATSPSPGQLCGAVDTSAFRGP